MSDVDGLGYSNINVALPNLSILVMDRRRSMTIMVLLQAKTGQPLIWLFLTPMQRR
ncbi:MAG: hypothetical protein V2A53_07930 [bacterium]